MGMITLKLRTVSESEIEVDEDEYRAAKNAGGADQYLDVYLSDLGSEETTVTEPDGTEFDPYRYEG